LLSAIRKTGFIAITAGVRLAVLTAIGGISYFQPDINGAALGVLAFAGSFAAESMVLGWRFYGQARRPGSLFPSSLAGSP
jgi:hypothetical protein